MLTIAYAIVAAWVLAWMDMGIHDWYFPPSVITAVLIGVAICWHEVKEADR